MQEMVKSGFKEAAERRVTRRTYDLKEHGITLHDKYLTRVAEVAGAGFVALGRPVVAKRHKAAVCSARPPSSSRDCPAARSALSN